MPFSASYLQLALAHALNSRVINDGNVWRDFSRRKSLILYCGGINVVSLFCSQEKLIFTLAHALNSRVINDGNVWRDFSRRKSLILYCGGINVVSLFCSQEKLIFTVNHGSL